MSLLNLDAELRDLDDLLEHLPEEIDPVFKGLLLSCSILLKHINGKEATPELATVAGIAMKLGDAAMQYGAKVEQLDKANIVLEHVKKQQLLN